MGVRGKGFGVSGVRSREQQALIPHKRHGERRIQHGTNGTEIPTWHDLFNNGRIVPILGHLASMLSTSEEVWLVS